MRRRNSRSGWERRPLPVVVGLVLAGAVTVTLTVPGSLSALTGSTRADAVFGAGTVVLTTAAGGQAFFAAGNAKPGDTTRACTPVRYQGTLPATVRSYAVSTGALAGAAALTVTRGSATATPGGSCARFVPDPGGGVLYDGLLADYPAGGVPDPAPVWYADEVHVYEVAVRVVDDPAARGATVRTDFTWEARS